MRAAIALVVVVSGACGDNRVPAAEFGRQLASNPALSEAPDNYVACTTCHQTGSPDAARIDPGYTLVDVAGRGAWYGGNEQALLDAVNFCMVSFMGGTPLAADDPVSLALYEYLASISPRANAPARPMTIVRYVLELPRGDASRGEAVYTAACVRCHGTYGAGDGSNPDAPVMPSVFDGYAQKFPGLSKSQLVIEKVRHGGLFGISGTMPPYSLEALSNDDLAALLSYLQL